MWGIFSIDKQGQLFLVKKKKGSKKDVEELIRSVKNKECYYVVLKLY